MKEEDDGDVVLNVLGCRADILGTREEDRRVTDQELCEQGGGPGLALIPYPILLPSLTISHTVPVVVKHNEKRRRRKGQR